MTIHLHIDRLVLHGIALDRKHQTGLRLVVENEIRQQLGSAGAKENLATTGSRAMARGGEIHTTKPATPGHLGNQIGAAVARGFRR